MTVHPILAALRRHKVGVLLIVIQIALTLAIVCNVLFIVNQRIERMYRPTGLIESDLFLISQSYVGIHTGDNQAILNQLDSLQLTDLAALRGLPDVQSVTPVNTLPLLRYVWGGEIALKPGSLHGLASVNYFKGDQDMLSTLGLQLIAGRDFSIADVEHHPARGNFSPSAVIVTKALATKLFQNGDALGRSVYLDGGTKPCVIVGVVEQMFSANPNSDGPNAWYSVLIPSRIDSVSTMYAVRSLHGRMQAAVHEARKALFKVNPTRVIQSGDRYSFNGIHSYAQIREVGYALDIFVAQVLTLICVILLLTTCVGMAGLTNFWVSQRNKQIGIRRALGARRIDILHYFQIENLIIVGGGCVVGSALSFLINQTLLQLFEMSRMPVWYVAVGTFVVLLLGQMAAFVPARRASNVPPITATKV